ncbi:hypothetical protein WDU94_013861 [Cyamophila willieti]
MEVDADDTITTKRILTRFKSDNGEVAGDLLDLPLNVNTEHLSLIVNSLLKQEEGTPYLFFVNEQEITKSLADALNLDTINTEEVVDIVYQRQAVFKVRPVTRCTSSMPGHAEAVISVKFSPDGRSLASGSGDTTVRFWDVNTQTPMFKCEGHKHWVLCIAWSPDSKRLVSGCKNGLIHAWDANTGKQIGQPMRGHKQWITALSWEPFHLNYQCRRFASSGKDGAIRIWDVILSQCVRVLTSHTRSVTSIRWGGSGLIYSASQDRTIKVWRASDGVMCRTLEGHAHWVNTLALSTDYAMRVEATSHYDRANFDPSKPEENAKQALVRYQSMCPEGEKLVSGSDDFTLFLWNPEKEKKSIGELFVKYLNLLWIYSVVHFLFLANRWS